MSQPTPANGQIDRRRFLLRSAATAAAAGAATFAGPGLALADNNNDNGALVPTPRPIPGGLPVGLPPPYDLIHLFLPGPTNVTLPFSGSQLMGLNVEPSTITNFNGKTALAYVVGQARGSDGTTYGLEVDIRAFKGRYRTNGEAHSGAFALI
jgi:hypothetical protein